MNTNKMLGIQDAVFVLEPSLYAMSGQWPGIAAAGRFGMYKCNPPRVSILLSAYLTRGVDYFGREVLPAIFDHFAERVLNGRVVAIDKMPLHESHCQRRFAWRQADSSSIANLSNTAGRFLTNRSTPNNSHLSLLRRRRHGDRFWTELARICSEGRFQTKREGKKTT